MMFWVLVGIFVAIAAGLAISHYRNRSDPNAGAPKYPPEDDSPSTHDDR